MTCVKGGKFRSRSEVGYTPLDFPRRVTATKVQSVSPILEVLHANEEGREGPCKFRRKRIPVVQSAVWESFKGDIPNSVILESGQL